VDRAGVNQARPAGQVQGSVAWPTAAPDESGECGALLAIKRSSGLFLARSGGTRDRQR
jgi:hypothetical protein